MTNPKLLILDEPGASLSPKLVRKVFQRIREIHESGVTIVVVSQFTRKALKITDYAYVLVAGQKVHENKSLQVLKNPDIAEIFLGVK